MKTSLLILALVPAIYAAPALPDHNSSDQPGPIKKSPYYKDLETGEMIHTLTDSKDLEPGEMNYHLPDSTDPETGENHPNLSIPPGDDSEGLRLSLFLEKMANLTSNLLSSTDQLAQMSGKSLLDVVKFPDSTAPIWFNSKREEHKTTWQEITTATLDGVDIAIKEMKDLTGAVTGQEMSQIASTIASAL